MRRHNSSLTTVPQSRTLRKAKRTTTSRLNRATAVCTGIRNASSGTPTVPAPKPDMPRTTKAANTTHTVMAIWIADRSSSIGLLEKKRDAADQEQRRDAAIEDLLVDPVAEESPDPRANQHQRQSHGDQQQRIAVVESELYVAGHAREGLEHEYRRHGRAERFLFVVQQVEIDHVHRARRRSKYRSEHARRGAEHR